MKLFRRMAVMVVRTWLAACTRNRRQPRAIINTYLPVEGTTADTKPKDGNVRNTVKND